MARKSFDELNQIKQRLNVDKLWSWSRVNLYHTSKYEYLLKYIKKEKELNEASVYLVLGGIAHGILEDLYTNKCSYESMIKTFENTWITSIEVLGLKFDRSDSEKNSLIKNKYYENLKKFFMQHIPINYKTSIEQFITIKIDEKKYLQGYIDCMYKDDNNCVHIIDFKTSTIYKGDKLNNECGQLVLYALAVHQLGLPINRIKTAWNFLKYQSVTVSMKNKSTKVRNIERSKIGESLKANATMWLKHFGYEETLEEYITDLIVKNDISCLPTEVQDKFVIEDCYVYIELDSDLIEKWRKYVADTISEIEALEKQFCDTNDDKLFWDNDDSLKQQSYYYYNLSGYTLNQLLPFKSYIERKESESNDILLFSKKVLADVQNNDMSWLDEL